MSKLSIKYSIVLRITLSYADFKRNIEATYL